MKIEDLENNIPLIEILKNLLLIDFVELMFILIIILIIINKYLYMFYIKLLNKILLLIPKKYLPNFLKNRTNYLDKAIELNNKFFKILLVIVLILLLLFKIFNIYVSSELYSNIDDYILVYNYIKNNKLLLLVIPLLGNNFKLKGVTRTPFSFRIINKFTSLVPFTLHLRVSGYQGVMLLCIICYINPLFSYIFNRVKIRITTY